MANPNAIVGNGGDLTIGNKAYLPFIGPSGRMLALGPNFEIIVSDLTDTAATLLINPSQEAIPLTVALRTARAALKAKLLLLGSAIQQTPTGFELAGAANDLANDTFTKTSDTTYSGTKGGSILFFDGTWSVLDSLSNTLYAVADSNFPSGPWSDAGGGEPVPSLLSLNDDTFAIGIGLPGTPQLVGIRIVRDPSQLANLQEWCDESSSPVTWIDNNGRLRGISQPFSGTVELTNGVNYGTVGDLDLDFTPSGVIATVNGADADGPPLYVTVPRNSITSHGFDYTINAIQQDGSILVYTCVP